MNTKRIIARLGRIPPSYYVVEEIQRREIERVFEPSWICVGFVEDLRSHNDFVTAQIGNRGLVVQNFKGKLRAFRNVCSHRYSRIQTQRSGNRPLQCPYHGWTYDEEGVPGGITMNRQCFEFDEEDKAALALESYHVDSVGHFVFVRMTPSGLTLRAFLGSFYDDLEHVSQVCTDRFEIANFYWSANWKVGMDNAAEGYHVPLVHAETFGKILPLNLEISVDAEHSRYTGALKHESIRWWQNVRNAIGLQPSSIYPEYANFLIFPNIVVTFSFGSFLTFQTIEPRSTHQLNINSTAWLAKNDGRAARGMVIDSLKVFSDLVRREDQAICETVHSGMLDVLKERPLVLGNLEGRIAHFQSAYMSRMGRLM